MPCARQRFARATKNDPTAEGIDKYARAWYLHYHGTEEGWDRLVSRVAAGERQPPNNFGSTISRALTASEARCRCRRSPISTRSRSANGSSFYRIATTHPTTRRRRKRSGRRSARSSAAGARLKLPVKVISAAPERIEAALAEANQASNTADIEISLVHELRPLPAVGSTISIIGVLSDYRPTPFLFFLTKAELAEESMPVAGGACATPRPQVCTRDYRPAAACARTAAGGPYGNACSACADPDIVSQAAGACP